MSSAAAYFASGGSLYPGAALIVVATILPRKWSLAVSSLSWLGLIMIAAASPPLPWWGFCAFAAIFLFWLFAPVRGGSNRVRGIASLALAAAAISIVAWEIPYRRLPVIRERADDHIVIIGDSLSSGIGNGNPWPVFFQQSTGVRVVNLSRPGAGVHDALSAPINSSDHLILIELGGNDLLSGLPADRFADGLDALLGRLYAPGRTLVMFELPLIPSKVSYGRAQRTLAKKFGVSLIPKRFLAKILSAPNATFDGLHLSETGAQDMARLVAQILSPLMREPQTRDKESPNNP